MVSTYNIILFTTAAAIFSAPAVLLVPTQRAPRLSNGWRKYGTGCTKNTVENAAQPIP